MRDYQYRTVLSPDELADPIIAAAHAVAQRAHAGRLRGKLDDLPEICHPILAYDLARRMGETNPVFLAACLLHDSLEDHNDYVGRRNHFRMYNDLLVEMDARQVPDGEMKALQIYDLAQQVTNPDERDQGLKMQAQIDHMGFASFDGKRLKILDQSASLVCRLLGDNDPKRFTDAKEEGFLQKAENVVQAIVQSVRSDWEAEALRPYEHLFAVSLDYARRLPPGPQERLKRNYMRNTIYFDDLFSDLTTYQRVVRDYPKVQDVYYPKLNAAQPRECIMRIELVGGEVAGWVQKIDPGAGASVLNLQQEELPKMLKTVHDLKNRFNPLKVEAQTRIAMPANASGRHFKIMPPMELELFCAAARRSKALSMAESMRLEDWAKKKSGRGGDAPAR